MKYHLKGYITALMLIVSLAGTMNAHAVDRLMFLKGSTIMESSIDAMIALPGGGIINGADIYRGFTQIPFAQDDLLVHNLDNNSFAVYRDSAYFRSGILENATPFELFVHVPPKQVVLSLFEYQSLYGETTLDGLLSLPGAVVFYDLIPYAVSGSGSGGGGGGGSGGGGGGGDTTPPILNLPGNITVDATSDQGAEVVFSVSATDNLDSNPDISCTPASGSLFPIGTTTVTCTATDDSNNSSQGSFTVTVNGNLPPVCDANGPYTAECGAPVTLDGTGSFDPEAALLTFLWEGPFEGTQASGPSPSVIFPAPTGLKSVSLLVDDGEDSDQCTGQVIVQDTSAPSIVVPDDVVAECAAPAGTSVTLGSATATDSCDPNPLVTNDAPSLFPVGETMVTWTATDADNNQANATQMVTVVDTVPPEVFCNAPSTIDPTDAPVSYMATATDQCQDTLAPQITDFDCFKFTKKGKRISKTESCEISLAGDQITISDSGGVGDMITWTVVATDASGNSTERTCLLEVVNPSGKK